VAQGVGPEFKPQYHKEKRRLSLEGVRMVTRGIQGGERVCCVESFLFLTWPDVDILFTAFFFFFEWEWNLNSRLCTCKAGAVPREPHFQSILLWLLEMCLQRFCLHWPWTLILPISVF
jgi:hypothetical protein